MPTLVILRHAEAVDSKANDHARPLTARGREDAASVGRSLQAMLSSPVFIVSSDARRAMETAEFAFPSVAITSTGKLYDASPGALLQALQGVPAATDVVVLVGHNPGLSDFAKQMVRTASADDRARIRAGMPKGGAAVYTFDQPWAAVAPGSGILTATLVPDGRDWDS